MKYYLNIIFLLLLFAGSSCKSDEECRKTKTVNFVSSFYHVAYIDSTDTYKYSKLSIDSITIRGLKTDTLTNSFILIDSLIYNNSKNISSVTLPLNHSTNETKFQVKINEFTDTISIYHTNSDFYLSLECGCIKTFAIDTILSTNNFIDSLKIKNHTINNTNAEHLYIYH